MEICFETVNGVQVAHLQCYLDQMGAENFKFVLLERLEEGKTMILDLEKLVNIDSFGLDALLATVQMPSGMPVATVAINGAANAALLGVQILAVEDAQLAAKLDAARAEAAAKVLEKNAALEAKYAK